jgi:GH15 family glucan-1,4-alpha-glucosidase
LPIGNGNVLINFDLNCNLRDIYFPYVGQENQALDHLSHFGVWTEEGFFWIDDPEASRKAGYLENSLVTDILCRHDRLGIRLNIQDGVYHKDNIYIRKINAANDLDHERTVRLYFHLDLHLYGNAIGDTVYYDPDLRSLVFYKEHRYMSLSGCRGESRTAGISSYAIGQKELHGLQGTWRDAEDGHLGRNPIAQGSVDGTAELELRIPGKGSAEAWFWVCFGTNIREIRKLENEIRETGPQKCLQRTREYWVNWVHKDPHDLGSLDGEIAGMYRRSLLTVRTNMDNRGAIIAANDSDILKFARDTYSYMWPRDGALIAHALDRSGYFPLTRKFFDFCKRAISPEGYLMHKYNPDGTVGSSWHPWVNPKGDKQLPIQEDETALVLFALWHHHRLADTLSGSRDDYERFVIPAADFITSYRDASGLPLPSYDLWEERYGVFAFTVSSVYAGLVAASNFARFHGEPTRSIHYRETAEKLKQAVEKQMFHQENGRFVRALYWNDDKQQYEADLTLDASLYALFDFGMFSPDDPRIAGTMKQLRERLWVQTEIGGMARYENDYYHQVSQDVAKVAGNPWFICTLWHAEWLIAVAQTREDLKEAEQCLHWAVRHALPSGIMAEQVDPYRGAPLSVSPLTWSHSTFIKVVQEYIAKLKALEGKKQKRREKTSDAAILLAP